MLPREEAGAETGLLLDMDQSGIGVAYNQLIQELPIINGEKVLTLYRGTNEANTELVARNKDGHLYIVLGEAESEDGQTTGWITNSNLTFVYSHLTDLPMPDAFLDRVLVVYSASLFACKEDIVKEVCRVLKPGGVFDVLYFDIKEHVNAYFFEIKKEDYLKEEGLIETEEPLFS